jgi:hypothetical protein
MCQELRALRDRKDAIKEEEKEVNKRIRILTEQELPEHMEENEIDKVSIDGVGTVFIQQQLYANVKSDDREALYEELRNTGNEDMIVDHVWPNTLKAWCKEQISNGKPLPEVVNAHFVPTAMLRRK